MSNIHPQLEKVARALYADTMSRWRSPLALQVDGWKEFLPVARAAVQALLEPDAMARWRGSIMFERTKAEGYEAGEAAELILSAMLLPLVEGEG